jgi:hypothetical protein
MVFRLNAKNLFLTYPKCTITKEEAYDLLSSLLPIEKFIIAQELHEDETPHLHVYIKCSKKVDIKSEKFLDLNGYHGKYETCRSDVAVRKYCIKEDCYLTNIDNFQPICAPLRVLMSNNKEEALPIIKNDPNLARDYIRNAPQVEASLDFIFNNDNEDDNIDKNTDLFFRDVRGIANWKRNKKALWIHGPTGTGKTEFAKNLFTNPLLISHIDQLKKLKSTNDGIIFDDMNFENYRREEQIHILDVKNDRGINVKHGVVVIKKGTPRVFTSNVPIFTFDPAISRRIRYIKVEEDLRIMSGRDSISSIDSLIPPLEAFSIKKY